jgi:hypothetical protein
MLCLHCRVPIDLSENDVEDVAVQCDFCLKPAHLDCLSQDEVESYSDNDVFMCSGCSSAAASFANKPSNDGCRIVFNVCFLF